MKLNLLFILFLLVVLSWADAGAQTEKKALAGNSLFVNKKDSLSTKSDSLAGNSTVRKDSVPKHIPRIATRRSAIIPGWGQAYNKEYWKIPLVYGILAIPTGLYFYNNSYYKKTKFAYCYENVADLPDYISEKIFDCFFSGCIPVYWGSNTIQDYIPDGCYIDRRKFNSTEEVHQFLLRINASQYAEYQSNIKQFLNSPIAMQFDTTTYVSTIINKISQDLGL